MNIGQLQPVEFARMLHADGVAFEWGPFSTRVITDLPELAAPLYTLYRDFPIWEGQICDFNVDVRKKRGVFWSTSSDAEFYREDIQPFAPFERSLALCMFEWGLNWCVYSSVHKYLILHAAVVAKDDRALLLSGRPGAGKSTLCAALICSGWRLLSDELALIDLNTLEIIPLCRPVCLKEGSISHVQDLAPHAVFGPIVDGTHKGKVSHMRPPSDSLRRMFDIATPAWIVLPNYDEDVNSDMVPLSKASAFFELADNSFNYEILGRQGFQTLARVIERIGCYRLNHASTGEGLAAIEEITK